jgi:DNA polymerase-3 subunit beta
MLVNRKKLLAAVKAAAATIGRPGIPALAGVMLEADEGTLELTATDLEVSVRVRIRTDETESWRALVPGKVMVDALKFSASEVVEISPTLEGGFTAGGTTIRLLVAEDFPAIQDPPAESIELGSGDFVSAVKSASSAASQDEARPILTATMLEAAAAGASNIRFVATDSYRLHAADAPATVTADTPRALVPAPALKRALKVMGKAQGPVGISVTDSHVALRIPVPFTNYRATIQATVIEGEFPNYRQLIPEVGEYGRLEYGPELADALKQAAALIGPAGRQAFGTPALLSLNGSVSVSVKSPDLAEFAATVPAGWSGADLEVRFNPEYLLGCIEATDGAPAFIPDALKPTTFKRDGRLALVMPIRPPSS